MANESKATYWYALGIYIIFGAYFWYVFHSLGGFVGTNFTPESATGFSVKNPDFNLWNNVLASVLTAVVVVILFASDKLKEYVVDVGDELTRVSWADVKETQKATVVVIGLVIVSSIFLFFADFVFLKAVNLVLGTAGG
jgi:preprotein translocase SecE subunit